MQASVHCRCLDGRDTGGNKPWKEKPQENEVSLGRGLWLDSRIRIGDQSLRSAA